MAPIPAELPADYKIRRLQLSDRDRFEELLLDVQKRFSLRGVATLMVYEKIHESCDHN